MKISRLAHTKAPAEQFEVTWEQLKVWLLRHEPTATKHAAILWSPAFYKTPKSRNRTDLCEGVSVFVMDADHGPSDKKSVITHADLALITQRLRADGIEHLIISSYSYLTAGARARFVIPLTSPVDPKRWPTLWRILAARYAPSASQPLGTFADRQCRDPVHRYFRSSCPPGAIEADRVLSIPVSGIPIDPEVVLRGVPIDAREENEVTVEPVHAAKMEDLRDVLRKWQRRKNAPWAFALKNLIAGERIADDGSKDDTIAKLCFAIIKDAPHITTDSLADLFTPSLQMMRVDPQQYRASLVDKIDRGRTYREDNRSRELKTDRERPIVQTNQEKIYIRVGPKYVGPYTRKQMPEAIRQLLPDDVADNRIVLADAEGKRLTEGAIVERYGSTVLHVTYEVGRQEDLLEEDTLVLGCANKTSEPRWVPEVEAFLNVLAPNPQVLADLKTWLIVAKTKPMETLAALQVIGPKSVGKSLFAQAISTLWHDDGPIDAVEAFSQFNARLMDCPFIFGDEGLPTQKPGQMSFSQAFRSLISKTNIKVEKKGQMPTVAKGALRIMFAANHSSSLSFEEAYNADDIEAIADRWYRFHVDPERVDMLAPRVDPNDRDSERYWPHGFPAKVIEGMLPHVMQLAFTTRVEQNGRFWIRGDREEIRRDLQTTGYLRDFVLQWIVSWIFNPAGVDAGGAKLKSHIDFDRKIYVASHEVAEHWHAYIPPSQKVPSVGIVGRTLSVFASRSFRGGHGDMKTGRTRMYEIDKGILLRWCETGGRAPEELEDQLTKVRRHLQVVK